MIAGKALLDYTNLFSTNDYKKNGEMTYKYFKTNAVNENKDPEFRFKKIYLK